MISEMTGAQIAHVPNPRNEADENDLEVENRGLLGLGLKPITLEAGLLRGDHARSPRSTRRTAIRPRSPASRAGSARAPAERRNDEGSCHRRRWLYRRKPRCRHLAGGQGYRGRPCLTILSAGQLDAICPSGVEIALGDFTGEGPTPASDALRGVDAVVHLAALSGVMDSVVDPGRVSRSMSKGTFQLLELARGRVIGS